MVGIQQSRPERPLIIMHPSSTPPDGYMECNGATISRTTYAWLFGKIGTTYGAGDGSTTFKLPDFRGEFVRGWDNGRGVDAGRGIGSAQTDQNKAHTHGTMFARVTNMLTGGSTTVLTGSGSNVTVTSQSDGGSEARPRNVAQMFCIATKP